MVPQEGEIIIQSENLTFKLNAKTSSSWMSFLAHVPQDIYLSNTSIRNNIMTVFGETDIIVQQPQMNEDLALACYVSLIDEFADKLPEGIDSVVGERGITLSGGQKQRIGIARALVKKRPLLILDEATSSLDVTTESAILNNIMKFYPGTTIIMITHRKESAEYCGKIIEVIDGKVFCS